MVDPIPFDQPFTGYGAQPNAAASAPGAYDAEVKARLAQMRGTPAAGPAPVASGAPPRITPPSWLKTAGGFGTRLAASTGAGAVVAGQVMGAANAAVDTAAGATPENRPERALSILGGADITGLGARMGNLLTGGDFTNRAAVNPMLGPAGAEFAARGAGANGRVPAPAPVAPAIDAEAAPAGADQEAMGAANLRTANAPGFGAGIIGRRALDTGMTPVGTGGIRNNETGQVTGINAGPHAPVRVDRLGNQIEGGETDYANRGLIGGFFGAMGKVSQANTDRRQANLNTKLAIDAATGGATAQEHLANAQSKSLITGMTAKLLDPSVPETVKSQIRSSLIAMHGRPDAGGHPSVPMGGVGMNPQKDPTLVFDPRTKTTQLVMPTVASQRITDAHIKALMEAHGLSRAETIKALKEAGHDTSGVK